MGYKATSSAEAMTRDDDDDASTAQAKAIMDRIAKLAEDAWGADDDGYSTRRDSRVACASDFSSFTIEEPRPPQLSD